MTSAENSTIQNLRSNVETLLKYKNSNQKLSCGEAIQQLLDKAAEMFPKWLGQNSKTFMEAFDRIAGQGNYVAEIFPGMSHAGGTVDGEAFACGKLLKTRTTFGQLRTRYRCYELRR